MTAFSRRALPLGLLGVAALTLAACSGGSEPSASSDGGVAYGASKDEYIAAFEEIDPIELRMQTEGSSGSDAAAGRETFAEALSEWSGGKITVEMGWANSFVPDALDWNDALADGRLDIALYLPTYEPDIYPLYNELGNASALDPWTVTAGPIQAGWMNQIGFQEEYLAEIEDTGVVPLLANVPFFNFNTLFCAKPLSDLSDFAGQQISASGTLKAAEVSALGAGPVAMPFTDQYEALQRGVITCALTSHGAYEAGGLAPLVPYIVADSRVAFESPLASLGIGKAVWDDLPLVAQQLIFDRLDVLMENEMLHQYIRMENGLAAAAENGGGTVELSADAADAVVAANEAAVDELTHGDEYRAASEEWTAIVEDELGFATDEPYVEWVESGAYAEREYEAYIDRLYEQVLLPHRPGGE